MTETETETSPSPPGDPPASTETEDSSDDLAEAENSPEEASQHGSILEWFTRREAIYEARERVHHLPAAQQRALLRAYLAEEGAERALNPVDPFRHGSGASLALSLYREALRWSLAAQPEAEDFADLAAAWSGTQRALLEELTGETGHVERIERILIQKDYAASADLHEEEQRQAAWSARILVGALLERAEGGEREVRRLHLQRWLRGIFVLASMIALFAGLWFGAQRLLAGPDLAAGKSWKASSAYRGLNAAAHVCDGVETNILFHTNEEDRPWFEIDLGASTQISIVEVRNRTDGLQERAVPMVIELSEDHNRWSEAARRNDTFNTWKAKFSPRKARYVRLKVLRKTFLHLESVTVRAK